MMLRAGHRLVPLAAAVATLAFAGDASERRLIRKDMKEGEVVFRIGQPDHESYVRNVKGEPEEKAWTYFPDPRDPDTLTVVTLRAGIVVAVERKVRRP